MVAENDFQIDKAHLEAILKDPRLKAALMKKMGLGEEANKDLHPTPSGTSVGGWPPYPLAPHGWLDFFPPFFNGPAASHAQLMPIWRKGRGPESR